MNVAIEVKGLKFRFEGADRDSLDLPALSFSAGERVLLAGRSGSGKSTLLKVLSGLWPIAGLSRRSGELLVGGAPPEEEDPFASGRMGLLFQSVEEQVLAATVADEVALSPVLRRMTPGERGLRVSRALESFGLGALAERPMAHLSGGERQRVLAAALWAADPEWLLLDEPFAHADGDGVRRITDLIGARPSRGLILAEHRLERVLSQVDRVLILHEGRLLLDAPRAEAVERPDLFHRAGLRLPILPGIFVAMGRHERPLAVADVPSLLERERDLGEVLITALEREVPGVQRGEPAREAVAARSGARPSISVSDSFSEEYPRLSGSLVRLAAVVVARGAARIGPLDLQADAGERIAVLGANGIGKSSLLEAVAGLLAPASGEIERLGRVGFVPQRPELSLICPSVADELRGSLLRRRADLPPKLHARARRAGLEQLLDAPPWSLSRGQRLRLAVQAQLADGPEILLLDEPTAGQDPAALGRLLADLEHHPGLILFSTHDLESALRAAGRIWLIGREGLLFDGPPRALLRRLDLIRAGALALPQTLRLRELLDARAAAELSNRGRA